MADQAPPLFAPAIAPGSLDPRGGWPHAWYVENENLRIQSFSSIAATIRVVLRFRNLDGSIQYDAYDHVANTNRTIAQTQHRLAAGWILGAYVFAVSGAPRRGQTFVTVQIVKGLSGAVVPLGPLIQGYVADTYDRAWPGSRIESPTDGRGAVRLVTGTDPAAGADWSETVPANARWRIVSFSFAFVTSATVANREIVILIDDGLNPHVLVPARVTQAASLTRTYGGFHGAVPFAPATDPSTIIPIPNITLPGGSRFGTFITNIQAGDNVNSPFLSIEEWIED